MSLGFIDELKKINFDSLILKLSSIKKHFLLIITIGLNELFSGVGGGLITNMIIGVIILINPLNFIQKD